MQNVQFLNLEYFFAHTYELLTNLHLGSAAMGVPDTVSAIALQIGIWGMILSFMLVVMIVYVSIRLLQVEHEGFHELEKKSHEEHAAVEHAEDMGQNGRWDHIMTLANSPTMGDWRRAILEADIMLSDVLDNQGYTGETVADQLRQANPFQMTTLDLAWQAHKVRNQIAHEGEKLALTERDVRATIDLYRRVFEEFGVL